MKKNNILSVAKSGRRLLYLVFLAGFLFSGNAMAQNGKKGKKENPVILSLNAFSFNDLLLAKEKRDSQSLYTMFNLLDWCASQKIAAVDLTGYYFPGYPEVPSDEYILQVRNKAKQPGIVISGTGIRNNFASPDPYSTVGFGMAREVPGVSEEGSFPAGIKTVAEWFPKKERALAAGIFNSGINIGAIPAPLRVSLIAGSLGWGWAFIITGAIGLIGLIFWWIFYESPKKHKKISSPELTYINSGDDKNEGGGEKVKWIKQQQYRQTWAFALAYILAWSLFSVLVPKMPKAEIYKSCSMRAITFHKPIQAT